MHAWVLVIPILRYKPSNKAVLIVQYRILSGVHYQEYSTPLFLYGAGAAAVTITTELRQQTAATKSLGRY